MINQDDLIGIQARALKILKKLNEKASYYEFFFKMNDFNQLTNILYLTEIYLMRNTDQEIKYNNQSSVQINRHGKLTELENNELHELIKQRVLNFENLLKTRALYQYVEHDINDLKACYSLVDPLTKNFYKLLELIDKASSATAVTSFEKREQLSILKNEVLEAINSNNNQESFDVLVNTFKSKIEKSTFPWTSKTKSLKAVESDLMLFFAEASNIDKTTHLISPKA